MKFHIAAAYLLSVSSSASAFVPLAARSTTAYTRSSVLSRNVLASPLAEDSASVEAGSKGRPIYDPLGLYPESSEEYRQGRIQALEPTSTQQQHAVDSMGLYPRDSPEYRESFELEQEYNRMNAGNDESRPIYDPMSLYSEQSSERQQGRVFSIEDEAQYEVQNDIRDPLGLYPKDSVEFERSLSLEQEALDAQSGRKLYDPLGLYPQGNIDDQGDSTTFETPTKQVLDPMNLYSIEQRASGEVQDQRGVAKSEALPFMAKPAVLNGELAGDAGFDPFGFSKSKSDLAFMRQAELKHARIAMLAVVGWPLSELFDKPLAAFLHMKPHLVDGDRVPSLLNGGLAHVNPFYWMGVLALAGLAEGIQLMNSKDGWAVTVNDEGGPGFDPLNLFPKDAAGQKRMELAEIKNGRVAMIAITVFALMEALTKTAVVDATPFLFHPPF